MFTEISEEDWFLTDSEALLDAARGYRVAKPIVGDPGTTPKAPPAPPRTPERQAPTGQLPEGLMQARRDPTPPPFAAPGPSIMTNVASGDIPEVLSSDTIKAPPPEDELLTDRPVAELPSVSGWPSLDQWFNNPDEGSKDEGADENTRRRRKRGKKKRWRLYSEDVYTPPQETYVPNPEEIEALKAAFKAKTPTPFDVPTNVIPGRPRKAKRPARADAVPIQPPPIIQGLPGVEPVPQRQEPIEAEATAAKAVEALPEDARTVLVRASAPDEDNESEHGTEPLLPAIRPPRLEEEDEEGTTDPHRPALRTEPDDPPPPPDDFIVTNDEVIAVLDSSDLAEGLVEDDEGNEDDVWESKVTVINPEQIKKWAVEINMPDDPPGADGPEVKADFIEFDDDEKTRIKDRDGEPTSLSEYIEFTDDEDSTASTDTNTSGLVAIPLTEDDIIEPEIVGLSTGEHTRAFKPAGHVRRRVERVTTITEVIDSETEYDARGTLSPDYFEPEQNEFLNTSPTIPYIPRLPAPEDDQPQSEEPQDEYPAYPPAPLAPFNQEPTDLERIQTFPLVPTGIDPHLLVLHDPEGNVASRYRLLDFKLKQISSERPARTVALTSPQSRSGTSLTVINLALIRAESPHVRIALVDLNFRNPELAGLLGLTPTIGLPEFILGECTLEQVMMRMDGTQCYLLPSVQTKILPSRLYKHPNLTRLFAGLYETFDLILMDLPPVLPQADINQINALIDAIILVVAAGRTKGPAVKRASEIIDKDKLVGVVLNDVQN